MPAAAPKNVKKKGKAKGNQYSTLTVSMQDDGVCATCGTDDDGCWICCDDCSTWHHTLCVGFPSDAHVEDIY